MILAIEPGAYGFDRQGYAFIKKCRRSRLNSIIGQHEKRQCWRNSLLHFLLLTLTASVKRNSKDLDQAIPCTKLGHKKVSPAAARSSGKLPGISRYFDFTVFL